MALQFPLWMAQTDSGYALGSGDVQLCEMVNREDAAALRYRANAYDKLFAALQAVAANAPAEQPEEEDYDDTESAYSNGQDVAAWESAEIARTALAEVAS